MKKTPINYLVVKDKIESSGLKSIGNASIRELVRLVNQIETQSGTKFIRMEMGVPGLEPDNIAIQAEIDALHRGVASKYPMIEGIISLKTEASRFAKLFLDINVESEHIIPTVGSMQGSFAAFLMTSRMHAQRKATLFIDPGFPVQKQQHKVLSIPYESFDVYNFRGDLLEPKLREYLQKGNISSILYSNPNNPSWICFTEKELETIGRLATEFDVIVIEDLAYFAMDFRTDKSVPGKEPYQPTVAKYTGNYILLISSSKAFSYAGQRVGLVCISNTLFNREFDELSNYYSSKVFGKAMIYGAIYALSAGTSHSAQYGFAALLKASNDGVFNFVESVIPYKKRASVMKNLFVKNGFNIVYDRDENNPLADGFYFTFSYPGFTGVELVEEMLYYGISAISLDITGSQRHEGIRACVSQVNENQYDDLNYRLSIFHDHHKKH